jgi:hypothetical protein
VISPRHSGGLWPEIGLLLLYAALRLHDLLRFPVFIDEAFHIGWARDVWSLHPYGSADEGKALIAWVFAPLWPFANGLWLSRAVVVITGLLGLAALLALGKRLIGRDAARMAALLMVLLPYTFFFDRLAFADSVAASLGLVATALIVHALDTRRRAISVLAGAALTLALLVKLSMAVFLAIPLLALVLLVTRSEWRSRLMTLVTIYGVSVASILVLVIVSMGRTDWGIEHIGGNFVSADAGTLPQRLFHSIGGFVQWMLVYSEPLVLAATAAALIQTFLLRDRRLLFLAALAILPAAEFWLIGRYILPRFYLVSIGAMLLLAGYAIMQFLTTYGKWPVARFVIAAFLLGAMFLPMFSFISTAYRNPTDLPLSEQDGADLIERSTSGYGLTEGAAWIESQAGQASSVTVICAVRITCDRLNLAMSHPQLINFERTDILTPEWVQQQIADGRRVLLAEDSPPLASAYQPGADFLMIRVASFPRPGGESTFNLYELRPATD